MPQFTLEPTFRTLEDAGYTACAHPRSVDGRCLDCGASKTLGLWMNSHMDYPRAPLTVSY